MNEEKKKLTLRSMAAAVAELNLGFGDNIEASAEVPVRVMDGRWQVWWLREFFCRWGVVIVVIVQRSP
jgi:hypothetical protein